MASRLGILRRSNFTEGVKVSTATAEFLRRWRNCSTCTSPQKMTEITRDYADDLLRMGYQEEWARRVIDNALKGYERLLFWVEKGETRRHKRAGDTETSRRHTKLFGKTNWYQDRKRKEENQRPNPDKIGNKKNAEKEEKEDKQVVVMFITMTEGSGLRRDFQEM